MEPLPDSEGFSPVANFAGIDFRLTVAHCLKLADDDKTDICANPVQVLLNLRNPAVLLRIAGVLTGHTAEELAEDLDGAGFHELRETIEGTIVDFFRADPSSHEFLTDLLVLNEKERKKLQREAIRETRDDLKQKETTADPTGGRLSGSSPASSEPIPENGRFPA